jgi:hypothetical protein
MGVRQIDRAAERAPEAGRGCGHRIHRDQRLRRIIHSRFGRTGSFVTLASSVPGKAYAVAAPQLFYPTGPGPARVQLPCTANTVSTYSDDGSQLRWHPRRAHHPRTQLLAAPGPIPLSVVLLNRGPTNISLSAPCPYYAITVSGSSVSGRGLVGGRFTEAAQDDLCSRLPRQILAGHSLTLEVGSTPYERESTWTKSSTLAIDWAIAGVPSAHATTTIS